MAKIRELQPAHKSDKVTVAEAARAFRKVRARRRELLESGANGNGHHRLDEEGGATQHVAEEDRPPASSDSNQA